jgi:hypothetical protein
VPVSIPTSKYSSSGNMMGVVYSMCFLSTTLPSTDDLTVAPSVNSAGDLVIRRR